MPIEVEVQPVIDKYAKALRGPRLLFDLWPTPRDRGRPAQKHSAICAAVVMGVTGAFEAFAEDLLAASLLRQGHGWAHVAANSDLSNPSVRTLAERLDKAAAVGVAAPAGWFVNLPKQHGHSTTWADKPFTWADVLSRSDSWIEVRHCLAHGAVTGIGSETWPGPVSRKGRGAAVSSANDDDILARVGSSGKRALYLRPTISCARIFSAGAMMCAQAVATELGETVDFSGVPTFFDV